MGYKANSLLAGAALLAFIFLRRQRQRDAAAREHGCQPPAKHQVKEVFTGFDFQVAINTDVPCLFHWHQKYGKTFETRQMFGLPSIGTIAPENIRVVHMASKEFGIEPFRLPGMEYLTGRGFLTVDGNLWSHSRKLLKPTFLRNNIMDLSVISNQMDRFFDKLPVDDSTIDLQPLLYDMFFATSLFFLLGVNPDDDLPGCPHKSVDFVYSFHDAIFRTMFKILLGRFWPLVPQAKYLHSCKVTHEYIDYHVSRALEDKDGLGDKKSMLQGLSAQTDERLYIRSQIIQGMLASQETISALLGNTLLLLSRHPSHWANLRAEVLREGDNLLNYDSLSNCKTIQNILKESLRLYPVFPVLARVALQDTRLPVGGGTNQADPVFVPKGTNVVMSYYAIHHDADIYGADVEEFIPDRWDHIHPDQYQFIPFGAGQRACLGQPKALVEAAYVVARLAGRYEILECRDKEPWKGEIKLTCKSANGCKVAFRKE